MKSSLYFEKDTSILKHGNKCYACKRFFFKTKLLDLFIYIYITHTHSGAEEGSQKVF